jgi:3-hydroxybutyryl-CoA dehydrogenase
MQLIAVVGAGTMGNGIAHVLASHGYQVNLVDVSDAALQRAIETISRNLDRQVAKQQLSPDQKTDTLARLHTHTLLGEAIRQADLVIEAATENTAVKLNIFQELDQNAPPGSILATNTSSISITRIAAVTHRPQQVIGMHFMNPVPIMKLVEVIKGYRTSEEVTAKIVALTVSLDKIPCVVKDYPGFIANRLLMPMINEAIGALQEGVGGVEQIDTIMKLGMAHPMGPLQLADFIGLDVCLAILHVLDEGFGNPKYAPCPLLVNMVQAGHLGIKTGEGFYQYGDSGSDKKVSPAFRNESRV